MFEIQCGKKQQDDRVCMGHFWIWSVSEKMKSGYIYKKLQKCFTFESLKLHNGLSNQLPISNTSCHTTSLYESIFWCLTLAPCRRYKAQYPEGFKIQVGFLQECPNHFKIDMHVKESSLPEISDAH